MKVFLMAMSLAVLGGCGEAAVNESEDFGLSAEQSTLDTRRRARIAAMAAAYDGELSFKNQYNALDPQIKRSSVTRGSAFDPSDDYWGLPRTDGYEEVAAYCAACHSLAIVMQQRVTAERWQYLLKWMVDKQGMAPLEREDNKIVETYLLKHFSSDD